MNSPVILLLIISNLYIKNKKLIAFHGNAKNIGYNRFYPLEYKKFAVSVLNIQNSSFEKKTNLIIKLRNEI